MGHHAKMANVTTQGSLAHTHHRSRSKSAIKFSALIWHRFPCGNYYSPAILQANDILLCNTRTISLFRSVNVRWSYDSYSQKERFIFV